MRAQVWRPRPGAGSGAPRGAAGSPRAAQAAGHRVVRSRAKTVASLVGATERGLMLPDDRHLPAEQVWDRGGRKGGCLRSERTGQHGPGKHPNHREPHGPFPSPHPVTIITPIALGAPSRMPPRGIEGDRRSHRGARSHPRRPAALGDVLGAARPTGDAVNETNRMPDLVYTPIDGASREPGGYTSANAESAKPEAAVEGP